MAPPEFNDALSSAGREPPMDDPRIDELCGRIYKNHRRAIDLIVERAGSVRAQIQAAFKEQIDAIPGVKVLWSGEQATAFLPEVWREALPDIGTDKPNGRCWLGLRLLIRYGICSMQLCTWNVSDTLTRNAVLSRLFQNREGLSIGKPLKSWPEQVQVRLWNDTFADLSDNDEPDIIVQKAVEKARHAVEKFKSIPTEVRAALAAHPAGSTPAARP